MYEKLSRYVFFGGIVSVFLSLFIWFVVGYPKLAIFVGLWPPTMFAFSTCARHMHKDKQG